MMSSRTALVRPEFSPLSIVRTLWKGKLVIVAIWLVTTLVAFAVIRKLPKSYVAETMILVESPQVPANYVPTSVGFDVQDQIAAFRHRILTAANVRVLSHRLGLSTEKSGPKEDHVLESIRSKVSIKPERGWEGTRTLAFRVSYESPNPLKAAAGANGLAEMLIDENIKTRESEARGTTEFLDAQLKEAKTRLDRIESSLGAYKLKHNGELPDQQSSLLTALAQLQSELRSTNDAISRGEQTKADLESAVAEPLSTDTISTAILPAIPSGTSLEPTPKKSEILQAQLDQLRLRYSDEHPEVKRLLAELEGEKRLEAAEPNSASDHKPEAPPASLPPSHNIPSPKRRQAAAREAQLARVQRNLETARNERAHIVREIETYESKIDRLPVTEQEITRLMRDYEISKTNYTSLLSKHLSAEMSSDLEKGQKSERITILEAAKPPQKPAQPKVVILIAAASLAGLVLGIALAFMNELRRGTVLGEWEIPREIPVLARLPRIQFDLDDAI